MPRKPRDPLLVIARFGVGLATVLTALTALTLAAAIPFVYAIRDKVLAFLVSNGAPPGAIAAVLGLQLLMTCAAVLGYFFFRNLYRIIDSVGEGNSFSPDNARRLNAMAWISLVVHALAVPLVILSNNLSHYSERFRVDVGFSFAGVLLALVLFVLARVFREGARMREDLEGTV